MRISHSILMRDSSMGERAGPIPWRDPGSIPGPATDVLCNYYSLTPILEPYIQLDVQEMRASSNWSQFPVKRLWATVLLDAISIYLRRIRVSGYSRVGREKETDRAVRWVESQCTAIEGFDWICDQLGIESKRLRQTLIDERKRSGPRFRRTT